jgi:hypothetical protein
MVSENQANITLPLGIVQRLDKFLETEEASTLGLTSRPQTVVMLLRDFLQNLPKKRRIVAKNKKKNTLLDITLIGNIPKCNECDSFDCKHVDQVIKSPQITKHLKKDYGMELVRQSESHKQQEISEEIEIEI